MCQKTNLKGSNGQNMQNANNPTPANPLQKYGGLRQNLATILNYHFDSILREVQTEILSLPQEEQTDIMDYITEFMESTFNYTRFTRNNLIPSIENELQ